MKVSLRILKSSLLSLFFIGRALAETNLLSPETRITEIPMGGVSDRVFGGSQTLFGVDRGNGRAISLRPVTELKPIRLESGPSIEGYSGEELLFTVKLGSTVGELADQLGYVFLKETLQGNLSYPGNKN